jgi:hypothetical protein
LIRTAHCEEIAITGKIKEFAFDGEAVGNLLRNCCFVISSDAITSQWANLEIRSGLFQDVMPNHVIEIMVPRFVRVAANVYAVGTFDFAGLHPLASVAIWNSRAGNGLLLHFRGMATKLRRAPVS